MSEGDFDWLDVVPARFRGSLAAFVGGYVSANVTLMHVLTEARSADEAVGVVSAALGSAPDGAGERLRDLSALLRDNPDAWSTVRDVLHEAEHSAGAGEGDPVAHWAGVFDRIARARPEGGVALYALGSPAMLAAATAEVAGWLRGLGVLGRDRHMLEIGCGIGRYVAALAPEMAWVTGLDVSGEMIAEAHRRCRHLPNVTLARSSGRDLSGVPDGSIDFVLAADVFPYLVLAGGDVASRHVGEAARVLRPGGTFAILNYSYRDDPDLDGRDLADAAAVAGLLLSTCAVKPLKLWDAEVFVLRKPTGAA